MHGRLLEKAVPAELVVVLERVCVRVWQSVSVFTLSMLSKRLLIRNQKWTSLYWKLCFSCETALGLLHTQT